ncbi:MAG TPA: hydantoinase B/oxoprolinase family protein [Polyangiales bacterium]|nr:hydantoinase B/oxoprolinase family protein [Polyangiales bacterium]
MGWTSHADRAGWQFWVDRGGTFTDVVARAPDGTIVTTKLLSENPEQYRDAAIEGMRRLLGCSPSDALPAGSIESVKMGTTVATNALLERRGEPTVLAITRGFRDQLRIGTQARPGLFDLQIRLPSMLYSAVVEVAERIGAHGDVLLRPDQDQLRTDFTAMYAQGFRSIAIVFMHAWRDGSHERIAAQIAREIGFEQVSVSHEVSPLMKLVPRGDTTVVDAYLSPILRRYVRQVDSALRHDQQHVPLFFMKSNGGLTNAQHFAGKDAILSGPAGGIVGMVRTSLSAGIDRCIGFDMGGTSTDVSHFAGTSLADCERDFDTLVAGVRMCTPMMSIHTVAAGGGSILQFDGQRLRVGPESAGAAPGPACYRRGGPLTVTDCNVMLGRIQPDFFPRVFGPRADAPIDREVVALQFDALAREVARASQTAVTAASVAAGCLQIAVANMVNAIQYISVQRGYDVTDYTLACFGGAGGQHACSIADELGMKRIYIHPLAGVLSAFGMGLADITAMHELAFERALGPEHSEALEQAAEQLAARARADVHAQGVGLDRIEVVQRAHLKYLGTDTAIVVGLSDEDAMRAEFASAYKRRFSFLMDDRELIVEALSVEAVGKTFDVDWVDPPAAAVSGKPVAHRQLYSEAEFREAAVYDRESLALGQAIDGPALIAEQNGTTVVDVGWRAIVTARNHLVLERHRPRVRASAPGTAVDPVMLEVFNNLFMSIAEQMGVRLANTAHSVNIKERLDFSCALFAADGDLIANAPHMPVHLGSMSESIKTVITRNAGRMRPGDVYMLNDPYHGGTHLPDVTVVMPVFEAHGAEIIFYVAARGHHADIGGVTPGSMPPASKNVEEEGVLIDNFKIIEAGRMRELEFRRLLSSARYPARNPDQNIADLRAQIAACEKGREELLRMVEQYGLDTVVAYTRHVMDNAEESVRRAITALADGEFAYSMDNGAVIRVKVSVDHAARSARVDFSGTSQQLESNFNAPPAVTHAAVLYVFRTLVAADIPMNAGCLRPIEVVIPSGCMLAPHYPAATVAGNVETSQCITDALYGALGIMGASQGTMNNFTFGDDRYQYYETIAGGAGAGDGFAGAAAVQTHMTNSRMTDPEVIELRFPVRIEEHSIRQGSGGEGRYRGGDGALRRIRFLEPLTAAILASRRVFPPYGMAGGAPGELGRTWVERSDGSQQLLEYADETRMEPGDVFVVSTPSGGGYGTPQ